MISKDMYRLLRHIPRWPKHKTLKDLRKIWFMDDLLVANLLDEAVSRGYVVRIGKDITDVFKLKHNLSEEGREAMEEYGDRLANSMKANIALVVSILGLVISFVAILN